jgi:hypothetical protein
MPLAHCIVRARGVVLVVLSGEQVGVLSPASKV